MRYLTLSEINTNLNLGKTVEQWLNPTFDEIEQLNILKWIEIEKDNEASITLRLSEVYDEGNEENLDIYDFTFVDLDEPFEEIRFITIEEMLEYITNNLNGGINKFINSGMCQEEYKSYLMESNAKKDVQKERTF